MTAVKILSNTNCIQLVTFLLLTASTALYVPNTFYTYDEIEPLVSYFLTKTKYRFSHKKQDFSNIHPMTLHTKMAAYQVPPLSEI